MSRLRGKIGRAAGVRLDVLIPCKRFSVGKSRLSGVLTPDERIELCRRLLDHTIALAQGIANCDRVAVVSDDEEVHARAAQAGASAVADPGRGLNVALSIGNDFLAGSGQQAALLILPIDLPLATPAALAPLISAAADVALAPDRHGAGTNIMRLKPPARPGFPFAYGADSLSRHVEGAKQHGFSVEIFQDPRLSFDVDEPADLEF